MESMNSGIMLESNFQVWRKSFKFSSQFNYFTMSCPCGLTRGEVLDLDRRERVPLVSGKCQNPLADGTEGICGKALGAHISSQGKVILCY